MFWFKHTSQIAALQQEIAELRDALEAQERFIHSDAFHELLDSRLDESKFDDLAQEAIERAVENAELRVRF
jgi:hypothetical protein